jgi:hypothetical protein
MLVWPGTEAPLTNIIYQDTQLGGQSRDDLIYGCMDVSEIQANRHFGLQRVNPTRGIVSEFIKARVNRRPRSGLAWSSGAVDFSISEMASFPRTSRGFKCRGFEETDSRGKRQ